MENKLFVNTPCLVSMFHGELGWFLQYFVSRLRFLKHNVYKDRKVILMGNPSYYCLVKDFCDYYIALPDWFNKLGLDYDCYEAVLPGSPPGSLTPPNVYSDLIQYIQQFYDRSQAIEFWPPRGYSMAIEEEQQMFLKYEFTPIYSDMPIAVVFPRNRERASNRNVPSFVWYEFVENLRKKFFVVLGGTPNGSALVDYKADNVINLISDNITDKLYRLMMYLRAAVICISSQSGPTHVGLLCGTPSYVIGHEQERHVVQCNRFSIPASFRYIPDYRMIDAKTMLEDVSNFMNDMIRNKWFKNLRQLMLVDSRINRPSLRTLEGKKGLIGIELGTDYGHNAINMLQNLDIKKLYLVDPYKPYGTWKETQEDYNTIKESAHLLLKDYSDKIVWIEKPSSEAISDIVEEQIDFVYIDGNHTTEDVKSDIELYGSKVKVGGLIAGHDYDYYQVRQVVESKFEVHNLGVCKDFPKTIDWWYVAGEPTTKVENLSNEILKRDCGILSAMIKKRVEG